MSIDAGASNRGLEPADEIIDSSYIVFLMMLTVNDSFSITIKMHLNIKYTRLLTTPVVIF